MNDVVNTHGRTEVDEESGLFRTGPVALGALDEEWVLRPQRAQWGRKFQHFILTFRDPAVAVPGAIFVIIVLACFLGPTVFHLENPNIGNLKDYTLPIGSHGHILGTNNLGNDMLSRLLHGGQVSLLVGFCATGLGFFTGIILGTTAGFCGGIIETVMMRVFDTLFAFPGLILALAIAAYLGPSVIHTIWAISFFSIAGFGRLSRGQTVRVRNFDYVVAAKAAGVPPLKMIFSHILPNVMPPLLAFAMFGVGGAMVAEAALSYLGLGIQVPQPSWGNLIASGDSYLATDPALVFMPAICLFMAVCSVNLFADSLRRRLALDR